jgi:hypothetical protein
LESVCRGNSTVGSNPTLSAKLPSASFGGASGLPVGCGSRRICTESLDPDLAAALRLRSESSSGLRPASLKRASGTESPYRMST